MFQRQKGIKSYQINSFPRQASCPYAVSTAPAVFGIYYYILYRTFCQGKNAFPMESMVKADYLAEINPASSISIFGEIDRI